MKFSFVVVVACLWQWTPSSHGFPARDELFPVEQPDGSVIYLMGNGDEKDSYYTDEKGYGVWQNDSGEYVYLDSLDGEIFATTELVGNHGPKSEFIPKGLGLHEKKDCTKKQLCGEKDLVGLVHNERKANHSGRRRTTQTTGKLKNLVILLHFKDHAENKNRKKDLPTKDDIDKLMNSDSPDPIGSLKTIYQKLSFGKLTIESTITEWFVTSESEAWYADGDSGTTNLHEAIREALTYLDVNNLINFSDFDEDGDGKIDAITIFHSGYAAEWMSKDEYGANYLDRIWSHKWYLFSDRDGSQLGPWESQDGVKIWEYHISSAFWGLQGDDIARVGVVAHETGHFLGLPDLYDQNRGGKGLGKYCLMANSWGWDQSQEPPGTMSCWTKIELGWVEPKRPVYGVNAVADSSTTPTCFKIGDGEFGFPKGEYLLIENRQPKDLDKKLPQGGLAIYKVDEAADLDSEGHPGQDNWPSNGKHYRVALLQADGQYDLEKGNNHGDKFDLFHAKGVNELLPSTKKEEDGPFPNTDSYKGGVLEKSSVKIHDISISGDVMTFVFSDDNAPIPTKNPTLRPSPTPTDQPTRQPSSIPSPRPSLRPSLRPSKIVDVPDPDRPVPTPPPTSCKQSELVALGEACDCKVEKPGKPWKSYEKYEKCVKKFAKNSECAVDELIAQANCKNSNNNDNNNNDNDTNNETPKDTCTDAVLLDLAFKCDCKVEKPGKPWKSYEKYEKCVEKAVKNSDCTPEEVKAKASCPDFNGTENPKPIEEDKDNPTGGGCSSFMNQADCKKNKKCKWKKNVCNPK